MTLLTEPEELLHTQSTASSRGTLASEEDRRRTGKIGRMS